MSIIKKAIRIYSNSNPKHILDSTKSLFTRNDKERAIIAGTLEVGKSVSYNDFLYLTSNFSTDILIRGNMCYVCIEHDWRDYTTDNEPNWLFTLKILNPGKDENEYIGENSKLKVEKIDKNLVNSHYGVV